MEMGSDFSQSAHAAHYNGNRRRRDSARQTTRAAQSASPSIGLLPADRPLVYKWPEKNKQKKSLGVSSKNFFVFCPQRPNGTGRAAGAFGGLQEQACEPDGSITAQHRGDGHLLLVVR